MTVEVTRIRLFFQRFSLVFYLGQIGIRQIIEKVSVGSLIKPRTSVFLGYKRTQYTLSSGRLGDKTKRREAYYTLVTPENSTP